MLHHGTLRTVRPLVVIGILSGPTQVGAQSVIYSYDALGRLATAAYLGGQLVTYSYDAAGNRTQVTSIPAPPVSDLAAINISAHVGTDRPALTARETQNHSAHISRNSPKTTKQSNDSFEGLQDRLQ